MFSFTLYRSLSRRRRAGISLACSPGVLVSHCDHRSISAREPEQRSGTLPVPLKPTTVAHLNVRDSITPRMSTDHCRDAVHETDMQIKEQIERGTSPPPATPPPPHPPHWPRPTTARMTMAIHQRRLSALFVLARAEVRRFGSSRISIIAFLPAERHLLLLFFFSLFFFGGGVIYQREWGESQHPHSFISPLTFFFCVSFPLWFPSSNPTVMASVSVYASVMESPSNF